jgi:hypothetical protein
VLLIERVEHCSTRMCQITNKVEQKRDRGGRGGSVGREGGHEGREGDKEGGREGEEMEGEWVGR